MDGHGNLYNVWTLRPFIVMHDLGDVLKNFWNFLFQSCISSLSCDVRAHWPQTWKNNASYLVYVNSTSLFLHQIVDSYRTYICKSCTLAAFIHPLHFITQSGDRYFCVSRFSFRSSICFLDHHLKQLHNVFPTCFVSPRFSLLVLLGLLLTIARTRLLLPFFQYSSVLYPQFL